MSSNRTIVQNAIQTPDGTILRSTHRHDFKEYEDRVSLETYMVDGGNDYIRRRINKIPAKNLDIYDDTPFEEARQKFLWGTYGIDGKSKLKYVLLEDMSDAHLMAIINDGYKVVNNLVDRELSYRKDNQISVEAKYL